MTVKNMSAAQLKKLIVKGNALRKSIAKDKQKLKEKEEELNEIKGVLLQQSLKQDLKRLDGEHEMMYITEIDVPVIEDYNAFSRYVLRNRALDLLPRGVNAKAYRERIESGKKVSGVGIFTRTRVNIKDKA